MSGNLAPALNLALLIIAWGEFGITSTYLKPINGHAGRFEWGCVWFYPDTTFPLAIPWKMWDVACLDSGESK